MITCAAVLDVLTRTDLAMLTDLIIDHGVPALLSLSVTGDMTIDPPDDLDRALLLAFNAHQRRNGRAGPDAPDLVETRCRTAAVAVEDMPTPWLLDASSDRTFVARFLTERVAAAVEQEPGLRASGQRWLRRRLGMLSDPQFRVLVAHRDLLILPSQRESRRQRRPSLG
jgi:hypothetical protein